MKRAREVIPPVYPALGRWVRDQRRRHRISQARLGELLGLSPTTIGLIERGQQAVFIHQFLEIHALLKRKAVGDARWARRRANG